VRKAQELALWFACHPRRSYATQSAALADLQQSAPGDLRLPVTGSNARNGVLNTLPDQ
jgi:hypothetical protein